MRIGFDFRPALRPNSRNRGIGRYTHELATALLRTNREHEFLLYAILGKQPNVTAAFEVRQTAYLRSPSRLNWLLDLALLPHYWRRDRIDLFHATELVSLTRVSSVKLWVTVHDLIPYIFWDEMVKRVPRDFSYSLKLAWKRLAQADRIITDSEHSKQDICERLQVRSEKVDVVYLGVSEQLRPLEPTVAREKLKKLWNLEGPYLLYVGGSDYRKNLGALIGAFSRLRERGYTGKLVLVGETFLMDIPEARKIREEIQRVGLATEVLFPGFVEDEDLSSFYSACDFFVFPSLYEGFGLPVLEAMKCGAPLLIGRTSSLPEVAGDCAHYFEPKEVESLIEVFWKAYGSSEAVEEKKRQGLQRAKSFTWQDAGQRVLELYSRHGI